MIIKSIFSSNFDPKKRKLKSIKFVIIHYTGMQSERESINRLINRRSKVSCHYLINNKGKIFRMVEENRIAWHAGKSCWKSYKNLNYNSIGIELVNKGHHLGYSSFSKKQIFSLLKICKKLRKKYKIKRENFLGHSDIAPTRKIDPGEKFPWKYLSNKKISIWHDLNSRKLKNLRRVNIQNNKSKFSFLKNLLQIGYCFRKNINKKDLKKIIKAFQRHFRQDLINGILDQECLKISLNLAKKVKNT